MDIILLPPGFSLSFKVGSYNVKVGGLAVECGRRFQAFFPYFTPFSQKLQGSNLKVAIIFSWLPALSENPAIYAEISIHHVFNLQTSLLRFQLEIQTYRIYSNKHSLRFIVLLHWLTISRFIVLLINSPLDHVFLVFYRHSQRWKFNTRKPSHAKPWMRSKNVISVVLIWEIW